MTCFSLIDAVKKRHRSEGLFPQLKAFTAFMTSRGLGLFQQYTWKMVALFRAFKGPVMSIFNLALQPPLMILLSPPVALSALLPPLHLVSTVLSWPHACSELTSSPISRSGTALRELLAVGVKINIISTLPQFSINDSEVRLCRLQTHPSHQISLCNNVGYKLTEDGSCTLTPLRPLQLPCNVIAI